MHYTLAAATLGLLILGGCNLGDTDIGDLDSDGTDSMASGTRGSGTETEAASGEETSTSGGIISGTGSGSVGETESEGQLCEFGSSVFGFTMQFPKEPEVEDQFRIRDASCTVDSHEVQSVEPMGPESIPHQIVQIFLSCDEVDGLSDQQYELAFTTPADQTIPLSADQQLDVHVEQTGGETSSRLIADFSSGGETLVRFYQAASFAGISICADASDPDRERFDTWLEPLSLQTTNAGCSNDGGAMQLEFVFGDALPILRGTVTDIPGEDRRVLIEQLDCNVEDDGTVEGWRVAMIDWAI